MTDFSTWRLKETAQLAFSFTLNNVSSGYWFPAENAALFYFYIWKIEKEG